MRYEIKCQDFLKIIPVICIALTIIISPETPRALDLGYGADLRQNALMMKWPSQMGNNPVSDARASQGKELAKCPQYKKVRILVGQSAKVVGFITGKTEISLVQNDWRVLIGF